MEKPSLEIDASTSEEIPRESQADTVPSVHHVISNVFVLGLGFGPTIDSLAVQSLTLKPSEGIRGRDL